MPYAVLLFDIPPSKVRLMDVVSASTSGRRRRSTDGIIVTVEIADAPATSKSCEFLMN